MRNLGTRDWHIETYSNWGALYILASHSNNNSSDTKKSEMSIVKQFKGNKILSSAEFVSLFKKYDKDGMYLYRSY
jgi:hypothetical protein